MLFCHKMHKTLKYHLVTLKPSFTVKTIDCVNQTGLTGRKLERLVQVTHMHAPRPRWQMAAILKNVKHYISATVWLILMKFDQ